jgi:DNA polymerase elongation subunit (family B)
MKKTITMKQETLEEAAERFYGEEEIVNDYDISGYLQSAFLTGAKWQQERSYSEEEVYTIQEISDLFIPIGKNGYIDNYLDYRLFSKDQPKLNFKEWFEKLKKQ